MQRNPSPQDLKLLPASSFVWPVTWRYEVQAPWGWTQQELTADVPMLFGEPGRSALLGRLLWQTAIAPAISRDVHLRAVWTATWKEISVPIPIQVDGHRGVQFGKSTPRDHAGQLVLMSGHNDSWGRRRLFLPSIPNAWVDGGLLAPAGWQALLTHARAMYMGLRPLAPGAVMRWLIAYLEDDHIAPANPYGVHFREVTSVRVCWHTDKAPERTSGLWP